jgi:mannobiose 2-epimerase
MQSSLLAQYRKELQEELQSILQWWICHMVKSSFEFNGEVDAYNKVLTHASRGLVMYSRILWTFSAAYQLQNRKEYLRTPLMKVTFGQLTIKVYRWKIENSYMARLLPYME